MKPSTPLGLLGTTVAMLAAASCNLGRQESTPIRVSLPLTTEVCQRITATSGPMQATYVTVVGADVPPVTELRDGVHPCAQPDETAETVSDLTVRVPLGGKRVLALAILGPALTAGDFELPGVNFEGLRLEIGEPRVIFFGGGAELGQREFLAGSVSVTMHPFVNLVGLTLLNGQPTRASVEFFRPRSAGGCPKGFDGVDDASIERLTSVSSTRQGLFFSSVPYLATEENCFSDPHGNEVFAFADNLQGDVALLIPGRAQNSAGGLQPGTLITESVMILRNTTRDRLNPGFVITGLTRVPDGGKVVLTISGYGLEPLGDRTIGDNLTLQRLVSGQPTETIGNLRLRIGAVKQIGLGDSLQTRLQSYSRFLQFGEKQPALVQSQFVNNDGSDLVLEAGDYTIDLPQEITSRTVSFRIR